MAGTPFDLVQGTLDVLILRALALQELQGMGILRRMTQMTRGAFNLRQALCFLLFIAWLIPSAAAIARENRAQRAVSVWRIARRRFQTSLLTVFAAVALFLALIGLYGLMAHSVGRRTREVGIRMALGAKRSDVILLMMKKAAFLLALGLMRGLVVSSFSTRAMQAFLFGVGGPRSSHNLVRLRFARWLRFGRVPDSRSAGRLHRSHASTSDGVRTTLRFWKRALA